MTLYLCFGYFHPRCLIKQWMMKTISCLMWLYVQLSHNEVKFKKQSLGSSFFFCFKLWWLATGRPFSANFNILKIPLTKKSIFHMFLPSECLTLSSLTHFCEKFVTRDFTEEEHVCALPQHLRIKCTPGKLDLVCHKFNSHFWAEKPETSYAEQTCQ